MELGISSYALAWSIGVPGYERPANPLTYQGLVDIAASHGIHRIQIADNLPLHPLSQEELDVLKAHADHSQVALEIGTRGTEPSLLLRYLELAQQLGSPLVRTLITTQVMEDAIGELQQVLPHYEQAGICLAIENHGLHTTGQLRDLFDRFPSPYLGCCLDTVNSFGALESPDQVISVLTPYVVNLHIKDFDISRVDHQMGFTVLGTPAGYGKLNIPDVLFTLRSHHKDPTAILEQWVPFTQTVEDTIKLEQNWLRQSLDYLVTLDFSR